jgi:hypothetical protein
MHLAQITLKILLTELGVQPSEDVYSQSWGRMLVGKLIQGVTSLSDVTSLSSKTNCGVTRVVCPVYM